MAEENPLLSGAEAHAHETKPESPRALLVAYHYPPCITSSGLHRSVCLSRDLRDFGWCPLVLTANPRAYRERRDDQLARVPKDVVVDRAFALDTLRRACGTPSYPQVAAYGDLVHLSYCDSTLDRVRTASFDGRAVGCRFP